jgi:hypothetical protein
MGVEPSDWTVYFSVMVRLAIRKKTARGRPQAEQELQDLRTAFEEMHTHLEKTVTALETSHRQRIEALTKSHQKDMTDLYRQLKQDRQAEMIELKELVGQLRAQASTGRSSSKPSPFTPLKAPQSHKQPVRPVGILKRPQLRARKNLTSSSPSPQPPKRWRSKAKALAPWQIVSGHRARSIPKESRRYWWSVRFSLPRGRRQT